MILAPALLPGPSRPAAILRAWAPGAAGGPFVSEL